MGNPKRSAGGGSQQHPTVRGTPPGRPQPPPRCERPSVHPSPLPAGTRRGGRTPEPAEPALRRLSHYLLARYQKGTRPVRDWRTTTDVAIDLMVYAILSVVSPLLPSRVGRGQLPAARAASARPQHGERYPVRGTLPAPSAHLPERRYPLC